MKNRVLQLVAIVLLVFIIRFLGINNHGSNSQPSHRSNTSRDRAPAQVAKHPRHEKTQQSTQDQKQRVQATVTSIIDGDTLIVNIQGKKEHLRLIGIDCPERRENEKSLRQADKLRIPLQKILSYGERATEFSSILFKEGSTITLEFDQERRDRFDRLLGYAYDISGNMLNKQILSAGFAKVLTIRPNNKYQHELNRASQEAQQTRQGLWKEYPQILQVH